MPLNLYLYCTERPSEAAAFLGIYVIRRGYKGGRSPGTPLQGWRRPGRLRMPSILRRRWEHEGSGESDRALFVVNSVGRFETVKFQDGVEGAR